MGVNTSRELAVDPATLGRSGTMLRIPRPERRAAPYSRAVSVTSSLPYRAHGTASNRLYAIGSPETSLKP